jgi:hypothetical protein
MNSEPSREEKQAVIDLVKYVRSLVPQLPTTAPIEQVWQELSGTQRRRIVRRLAEIDAME